MPHYLAAAARGQRGAALEDRPSLPLHLDAVTIAWNDLGGECSFSDVVTWARMAGADSDGTFWLLDRLRAIQHAQQKT